MNFNGRSNPRQAPCWLVGKNSSSKQGNLNVWLKSGYRTKRALLYSVLQYIIRLYRGDHLASYSSGQVLYDNCRVRYLHYLDLRVRRCELSSVHVLMVQVKFLKLTFTILIKSFS